MKIYDVLMMKANHNYLCGALVLEDAVDKYISEVEKAYGKKVLVRKFITDETNENGTAEILAYTKDGFRHMTV